MNTWLASLSFFITRKLLWRLWHTAYCIIWNIITLPFIDLMQPHPHNHTHTNVLTPDRCHTGPHTQCHVGKLCRTHTGWALAPSSPLHTVGDKHGPHPLKRQTGTEKTERVIIAVVTWTIFLQFHWNHSNLWFQPICLHAR